MARLDILIHCSLTLITLGIQFVLPSRENNTPYEGKQQQVVYELDQTKPPEGLRLVFPSRKAFYYIIAISFL